MCSLLFDNRNKLRLVLTQVLVWLLYGCCFMLPATGAYLLALSDLPVFIKTTVFGCLQFSTIAFLYVFVRSLQLKKKELVSLRKQNLLLEYAFLRSQVNPHFLYNALNTIFSQALEESPDLADNISRLSRLMRYSIRSTKPDVDTVPVEEELENLRTFIDIQKGRYNGSVSIDYSLEGKISGQYVIPFSMITAVENAFKYGELHDPFFPISVHVKLWPHQVSFLCQNKKRAKARSTLELHTMGIGLMNLEKRLKCSLKDQYTLRVTDTDDFYTFSLMIKNSHHDKLCNYR